VFAASVLAVGGGAPQALNHEGSVEIGGQDFEAMLVQHIARWLRQEDGIDISYDRAALRELIDRAEGVKISLSREEQAEIKVGPAQDLTGHPYHTRLKVSRALLEELVAPLVRQTVILSQRAIDGSGLATEEIAGILLVGGATSTPLVEKELDRAFGWPMAHAAPDVVALGAARHAAGLFDCYAPLSASPGEAIEAVLAPEAQRGAAPAASDAPESEGAQDTLLGILRSVRRAVSNGDIEAGIEAFEELLRQAREELSFLYSRRASELRQEDRLDEAQAMLEQGLAHWPDNAHIPKLLSALLADRAWALARQGKHSLCRKDLRKSLRYDPDNPSAQQLAAELSRIEGARGPRRRRKKKRR
jgi:hypothetical protein